jgi:hypothetical protein
MEAVRQEANSLVGRTVRCVWLDKWGYLGRELHPDESDVGHFTGEVWSFDNVEPEVLTVRGEQRWLQLTLDEVELIG